MCNGCYQRRRRHGDVAPRRTANGESRRWLASLLDTPTDKCVEWPFGMAAHGYGIVQISRDTKRRTRMATHIMLELAGRPQPDPNYEVLHSCDNPPCCNPRHLRWGTKGENNTERGVRGAEYLKALEAIALTVVSDVQDAARYGVPEHTIRRLLRKRAAHEGTP